MAPLAAGGALVLIGFMGAGKTEAARQAAAELGAQPLDSDQLLEQRLGTTIARFVEQRGEGPFRAEEERLVVELLNRVDRGAVVSLGGGAVLSPQVQAALGRHRVAYLETDAAGAWERLGAERHSRPLARDPDRFAALLEERRPLYERLADATLPAAAPSPFGAEAKPLARRAAWALGALLGLPGGAKLHWAWSAAGEYPVFVGRSLYLSAAPAGPEALAPPRLRAGRAFLVADRRAAIELGRPAWPAQASVELEGGEEQKTLATAERVWRALARGGMRRSDYLVAFGGGVVGDLAGFCAATYQRGVPIVHLPTTVVAQVDSAIGGKTGVDLPEAKNYVGAYHQPAAVVADLAALETLPPRELAAGWVEVLKTALIAGGELWREVSSGAPIDARIVHSCVRVKCGIVAADERDGSLRQLLNLGHTVGHAIEAATGYRRYRHGEAVGLGLLAALRLSSQAALRDQVRELLAARRLPTAVEGVDPERVLAALAYDKKRTGERVPFVLVQGPGRVVAGCEVGLDELRSAIAELIGSPDQAGSRGGERGR